MSNLIFLGLPPGLEPVLRDELKARGLPPEPYNLHGGVELKGDNDALWQVAHRSRITGSILLRVGRFEARSFKSLAAGLHLLKWDELAAPGTPFLIKVQSKRSRLYHKGAIEERVAGVLKARLGEPLPGQDPINVLIRISNDRARVSIDVAGERLHRRGWRKHIGKAPLRENLAAALVRAAEYKGQTPLWDPFCGSGTLPIEAALRDCVTAPRNYDFERWPSHSDKKYQKFLASLTSPEPDDHLMIGSDVDPKEVKAARANAIVAGLSRCAFHEGDFEAVAPQIPAGTTILTNLPYGRRTRGGAPLADTFRRFGAMLQRRTDLGPVFVLSGRRDLPKVTGLAWRRWVSFSNGGLPVSLMKLDREG